MGREAKGLSKGRYDETFAGEDGLFYAFVNVHYVNVKPSIFDEIAV